MSENAMLCITTTVIGRITAQAEQGLPFEVCGYLAADPRGRIIRDYPLTNTDKAADHFSMDPAEQFAAVRDMRARGLRLAAVYHSHPETPARPSGEDIRLAHDPDISYVIISLAGEKPVVRSFRIVRRRVAREPITIVGGERP